MATTPDGRRPYLLFTSKGCGSVLVEAMLELARVPYEREEHAFEQLGPSNARITRFNPLGQVPTLVLPDGSVMTESAAIALYLSEQAPEAGLAPPVGDDSRPQFLRWLIFLVADVYATYYYADKPEKFVNGAQAAGELKASIRAHRENLWRMVERAIEPAPWFLGRQLSALDVFVTVMTRWTPRREWFAANCPKLTSIVRRLDDDARLKPIWQRNF
ncbi:MAG TPA: glutathione S-transferase family protein [Steroidobacteraceae bacterium]|nr:glutathione S-transferase family protein [Steroidobacteraceae bacterium]